MTYLWIYRPYVFPTDIAGGALVFKTQTQKRQHHAHMMTQHRADSTQETWEGGGRKRMVGVTRAATALPLFLHPDLKRLQMTSSRAGPLHQYFPFIG